MKEVGLMVTCIFLIALPHQRVVAQAVENKALVQVEPVVVALLQMDPKGNDQQANLEKADVFCRQAAAKGADIALMPEMWNIGYTRFKPGDEADKQAFWDQAASKDGPWVQHFRRLADDLDMAIGVAYEQQWDPLPRNALTIYDRHGREVLTYAKVHTSDFKAMERNMTPGDDFFVAPLDTAKGTIQVGAMICFDREQPESARILMVKGAELILTLIVVGWMTCGCSSFESELGRMCWASPWPTTRGLIRTDTRRPLAHPVTVW